MSRTKNMFVLWMTVITLSWLFAACMDEETVGKDKQPKIPYTTWDNPVAFGEEVIIKGSNFSASDRVELEYMGERKNAQIKTCTDYELGFIVPEFSSDNSYESTLSTCVYLIRNGQERELGYLYIGSANVSAADQRVVMLLTPFYEYYFQYDWNGIREVVANDHYLGMESRYLIDKTDVTNLLVTFENNNGEADLYHIELEDGLVSAVFSEIDGRVYDVVRTGGDVLVKHIGDDASVNYRYREFETEINATHNNKQEYWRATSNRTAESGLTVNLNAMLGYRYDDELLNVLNLTGYLQKSTDRLITDFYYSESEDNVQQMAVEASYRFGEDYMQRIENVFTDVHYLEPYDYQYIPFEMYIVYE